MAERVEVTPFEGKQIRGYVDGCFDIMHSGHYNAIRQAKGLCDVLVVGIHSDTEIADNKAMPVMRQAERYALLEHVKWIDEILYDVPYSPQIATLDLARAEFCVHGDDMPVNAHGVCAYDDMIKAGRLRIVKRTEGVSTTDIIGRLLTFSRNQHPTEHTWDGLGASGMGLRVSASSAIDLCAAMKSPPSLLATLGLVEELAKRYGMRETDVQRLRSGIESCSASAAASVEEMAPEIAATADDNEPEAKRAKMLTNDASTKSIRTSAPVQLLASTRRITEFATARKPGQDDRIVYACGSFDMFHVGHAQFLKEARALGTFLLVGIHDDATVTREKGSSLPIMSLNERVLNVCACKWVDEVIIGAPREVTPDLMKTWDIHVVAHGTGQLRRGGERQCDKHFSYPKEMGVYRQISSRWPDICHETIVERIISSREAYKKRNEIRVQKEDDYYNSKSVANSPLEV